VSLALRPRTPTEIVDAGFRLIRVGYAQLVTLTLIAFAPSIIVSIISGGRLQDPQAILAAPGRAAVVVLVGFLCTAIADAAIIAAVSERYLHGGASSARVLTQTLRRLGVVIAGSLLRWLVVLLAILVTTFAFGLALGAALVAARAQAIAPVLTPIIVVIALIAPFYLYLRLFAVVPAIVLDRAPATGSLGRSWWLTRERAGAVFLALLIAWAVYLSIYIVVALAAQLVPFVPVRVLLGSAVQVLVYPFVGVVTTLLYYDLRVRKEGFDLEMMARDLGATEPPPAAP
jgi:hypothetical protein